MSGFASIFICFVLSSLVSVILVSTIIQRRILRRSRKKVCLLSLSKTLICKKAVPFLCVASMVLLFYLIGGVWLLESLFERLACSLGARALSFLLIKMGCSGTLALAIGFAVKALLAAEFATLTNYMQPAGGFSGAEAHSELREPSAESSSGASSEASVNQQPLIPQLQPPLLDDNIRRQQLNDRLGIHWFGYTYNDEVRDSFVETQLQIEKHIEGALVADGYSRQSVLSKINQIRASLFYPGGKALSESAYLNHLKEIRENGTRQSVPYRRIMRALNSYEFFLERN